MTDTERDSSARSSRRRRWEVQSKETFDISLAVKLDTPDRININKSGSHIGKRDLIEKPDVKKQIQNGESKVIADKNILNPFTTDGLSDKISAILIDAKRNDSEDSILDETNPFRSPCPPYCKEATPTAPPYSQNVEDFKDLSLPITKKSTQYGINIINSKISHQLQKLREDIVDENYIDNETSVPGVAVSGLLIGPSSSSTFNGNVSTIYCEKLNNFVVANEEQFVKSQKNEPFQDSLKKDTRATYATVLQTGFRTFSVMCQGIFAGIAIAHCIMVFMVRNNLDLFVNFGSMEYLFYVLMTFLSSICLISAFDRCDLAGQGIFSGNGLRIPWTPLFYFVCFTLSLIMIRAEDFITSFTNYPEFIQNKKGDVIAWWKYMSLAQSSFAVLGWLALVSDPHTDALSSRISELINH